MSESQEHDMHGGYGRCNGRRSVWVDDGDASNSYTQGTCPDCVPEAETFHQRWMRLSRTRDYAGALALLRTPIPEDHGLSGSKAVGPLDRTAPRDTPEPSSPPEDELSKLSGGWEPIETAPREEAFEILASTTGRVWFQCSWDEEEQRWKTFNRYLERDPHLSPAAKAFEPKWWIALPQDLAPVRGREGSVDRQTSSSTQCADPQAGRSGGGL